MKLEDVDEEELIGDESDQVPTVDPGEKCNGKTPKRTEDGSRILSEEGHALFGGYCNQRAGHGTDHVGEGRCKYHGGNAGAPEGNQNRTTHGLNADPFKYHQSLDRESKEFVADLSATIQDRVRERTGNVDHADRVLARRVAIKLHIVSKASEYVEENGLVQTVTTKNSSREKKAALLGEIRRYDDSIFADLKRLGVLDDPESQTANALGSWMGCVGDGQH